MILEERLTPETCNGLGRGALLFFFAFSTIVLIVGSPCSARYTALRGYIGIFGLTHYAIGAIRHENTIYPSRDDATPQISTGVLPHAKGTGRSKLHRTESNHTTPEPPVANPFMMRPVTLPEAFFFRTCKYS